MLDRRRKRRKLIEEEMEWNEGMRLFTERRDVWTGGRRAKRKRDSSHNNRTYVAHSDSSNTLGSGATADGGGGNNSEDQDLSSPPPSDADNDVDDSDPVELVPIAPRMLADNPIRANILPATYPSIYSKVVLQGLSPSVPINLSDMTRALVQGWKDEGQWPPKPTTTTTTTTADQDVVMFRKKNANSSTSTAGNRVRRSVGAMRKVFGFSGSGSASAQSNKDSGKDVVVEEAWKKI